MEGDEGIRALALRAVLECDDPTLLDLIYRILAQNNEEGRAD